MNYLGLADLFNGGGAGQAGDKFEGGGLLSAIANMVAKPYGYYDRRQQEQQAMAAGAPIGGGQPPQVNPQPAQQPGMTPGMSMGPFNQGMMPPQQEMPRMNPGMMAPQPGREQAMALGMPQQLQRQPYDSEAARAAQMYLMMNGKL